MTNTVRRLLAHPGRYLAVLGGVLAVAAATTVSLMTGSPHQAERGVPRHPTGIPSTRAEPDRASPTDLPSQEPTAPDGLPTGGTPDPPGIARNGPAGRTTNAPVPAATWSGAAEPEDLLKRRDALPEGVPEQVEFFFGGGGADCSLEKPPGPPYIGGAGPVIEIPTGLILCFYGFNYSKPLTVTITPPSGPAATMILPSDGGDFWARFRWLPGDPIGQYLVTAEQDTLDASLKFTLQHASSPRLWLARPPEPPAPGADFDLYLGGFPSNRPTLLHLYDGHTGRYRTSFTVPVDAVGEAHVVIDTKPDDPPGCYGIISGLAYEPGGTAESVFCIK